jgi:tetratricopeptide (TPR) repeat protein
MTKEWTPDQLVDEVCREQRQRWEAGDRVPAEVYLGRHPAIAADTACALELLFHEMLLRKERGEAPPFEEYAQRFPQLARQLQLVLEVDREIEHGHLLDLPGAATVQAGPVRPCGAYELLAEVGRGGMGVVYKARQPGLQRVVAVKMLLAGEYASPQVVARFRTEAEAVARLQHPNVVQIYEVGEWDGRPYLALEYIDGGSLEKKLAGTPQPFGQAAELVETLARAVDAAHQRGIVHRDLKPANVLLTADGVPKITDFGLAKLLEDPASPSRSGEIVGTPSYMAPEQAEGKARATGPAADVYSLGAILYELLTGRPPFRAETPMETVLQVGGQEPVPPRRLLPKVPRDLEVICLTCLQKEPGKRYGSALALAEDLRRFRAGESIRARPVGRGERLWRWCRRNPAVAALLATVAGLLVLGVTALAVGLVAFGRAAARADAEATSRQRILGFLMDLLKAPDPVSFLDPFQPDPPLSLRQVLDRAARVVGEEFRDQPVLQAQLLDRIGNVYRSLGQYEEARRLLEEALRLRQAVFDDGHPDVANSLHHLAWWHHDWGDYDQAEKLYRQALAARQRQGDELRVTATQFQLAWLYTERHDYEPAMRLFGEVIATRRRLLGDDHRDVAAARVALALIAFDRQSYVEAFKQFNAAMQAFRNQEGTGEVVEALQLVLRAGSRRALKNYPAAADDLRRCLEIARRALGDEHRYVALLLHELAQTQDAAGQTEEAERCYRECLDVVRRTVSLAHPRASVAVDNLARLLERQGRYQEGERLHQEVLDARRKRFSPEHPLVRGALTAYAECAHRYTELALRRGDGATAKEMAQKAVAIAAWNDRRPTTAPLHLHVWLSAKNNKPVHAFHTTFSPDGSYYLAGGDGCTLRLYEVATGRLVHELTGHKGWAGPAVFTPDSKQLLSAGNGDRTLRLWDVVSGREVRRFVGHHGDLQSVVLSPDGRRAVSGGADNTFRVWDVEEGREVRRFACAAEEQLCAFAPDGRHVLCRGGNRVGLRDVESGEPVCTLEGHTREVWGAAFLPDGRQVVSYGADATLRVWEVASGRENRHLDLGGDVADRCFAVCPDGRRFLLGRDHDRVVCVCDLTTGRELHRFPLASHPHGVSVSPDGRRAACGSFRGLVYLLALPE